MKRRRGIPAAALIAASLAGAGLRAAAPAGPARLPEPTLSAGRIEVPTFGDAANVRLLAGLLAEEDPTVREQAARDLGETHNPAALPHLRKALQDPSIDVRCAAAAAAAEFDPHQAGDIVRTALASPEGPVVLAGLRSALRMRLVPAGGGIRALLSGNDPTVQAAALRTMTRLGAAASPEELNRALGSASTVVRLRAAENAALLDEGGALVPALTGLCRRGRPAVRGAALAALGKLGGSAAGGVLASAAAHEHPFVRRGAVWGYRQAGEPGRVKPFLEDASGVVRLAAIVAVGELRCADCVGRLFELLLHGADDAHAAARSSLRRIGTDAVTSHAARTLERDGPRLRRMHAERRAIRAATPAPDQRPGQPDRLHRRMLTLSRNIGSCCRLLGCARSAQAYEEQLALLKSLDVDSPVLLEVAWALGRIGDRRAVKPLIEVLGTSVKNARAALAAALDGKPPPSPFDEKVAEAVIGALAELGAAEAADCILAAANTRVENIRLNGVVARTAEVAVRLAAAGRRAAAEQFVCEVLADPGSSLAGRFHAAKAAGTLRSAKALPALRRVLEKDRPCRTVMRAAAWAIQEITGTCPRLPDPKVFQGEWVIRKLGE